MTTEQGSPFGEPKVKRFNAHRMLGGVLAASSLFGAGTLVGRNSQESDQVAIRADRSAPAWLQKSRRIQKNLNTGKRMANVAIYGNDICDRFPEAKALPIRLDDNHYADVRMQGDSAKITVYVEKYANDEDAYFKNCFGGQTYGLANDSLTQEYVKLRIVERGDGQLEPEAQSYQTLTNSNNLSTYNAMEHERKTGCPLVMNTSNCQPPSFSP